MLYIYELYWTNINCSSHIFMITNNLMLSIVYVIFNTNYSLCEQIIHLVIYLVGYISEYERLLPPQI